MDIFQKKLGPNPTQQVFLDTQSSDYWVFLKKTCEDKSICSNYEKVIDSCAVAENLDNCVKIRMRGKDFSFCEDMKAMMASQKDFIPSDAQCLASNAAQSIVRLTAEKP